MKQIAGKESSQYQASGNINVNNIVQTKPNTKLSTLYKRLSEEFNSNNEIDDVIDDLLSYTTDTDVIGLEEKIRNGGREKSINRMLWLKQEYSKKLVRFQNYPSAQKIHTLILADVLHKFMTYIEPVIEQKVTEEELLAKIDSCIVEPVFKAIDEEGCDDIMGLNKADVSGMIYYLTGKCHIKWD